MTLMPFLEPARWAPKTDETPFQYWTSLSPAAPLFGVPWRFAGECGGSPQLQNFASDLSQAMMEHMNRSMRVMSDLSGSMAEAMPAQPWAGGASATPATPPGAVDPAPTPEAVEEAVEAVEKAVESVEKALAEAVPEPEAAPEEATAEVTAEAPADEPAAEKPGLLYDVAPETVDDLRRISGIGPKLAAELNAIGIYTYAQLSELTEENLAWIDTQLTSFRGRSLRDKWVDQAKALLAS